MGAGIIKFGVHPHCHQFWVGWPWPTFQGHSCQNTNLCYWTISCTNGCWDCDIPIILASLHDARLICKMGDLDLLSKPQLSKNGCLFKITDVKIQTLHLWVLGMWNFVSVLLAVSSRLSCAMGDLDLFSRSQLSKQECLFLDDIFAHIRMLGLWYFVSYLIPWLSSEVGELGVLQVHRYQNTNFDLLSGWSICNCGSCNFFYPASLL